MPFRRLFRSRWAALLWAAGIVWLAIDVADGTAPADPATDDALAAAALALNGQ